MWLWKGDDDEDAGGGHVDSMCWIAQPLSFTDFWRVLMDASRVSKMACRAAMLSLMVAVCGVDDDVVVASATCRVDEHEKPRVGFRVCDE
ncbi:hypothetical protein GUJ93_ZPchr0006g44537 [Zizania palustris]|uniref:Uncharacterized protein n=1 Tax=Zizania palustris TaxID=103762 RepID=A0A8J5VM59_ZIZPA|nr:hypothetical protein GUJ93_ZPchr0006g44537 [Zizania palustris]